MAADIEVAAQSTRLLLLKTLLDGPSYPSKLENDLKKHNKKMERKAISFHLKQLEHGLVEGKHEIGKDRPVAQHTYKITSRGRAVYNFPLSRLLYQWATCCEHSPSQFDLNKS
jgi:DNA-binding HxlR family transcriptional regulator